MISIRNIKSTDSGVLTVLYPNMTAAKIESMISEWNKKIYKGKYFEMFAVMDDDILVGTVSLYQHTSDCISAGPEIRTEYRRQGFAYQAIQAALQLAAKDGYKIAVAQVRKDNTPSIALHKKLGFEIDFDFINNKGKPCYYFIKSLACVR